MYEGYEQLLCQNGHYHIVDLHRQQSFWQHAYEMAYGSDEEEKNWRCPDCQAPLAWIHGVDTTNDAGDPAHLEIKTPAETCICTACGNVHQTKPVTYHIPENEGRRVKHSF